MSHNISTVYASARRSALYLLAIAPVCASAMLSATPPPTATELDRTFVGKVSQGGMYEVEASRVAEQRASAANVKDQAITEVHDHELVGANLKRLAAETGVPIAPKLNPEFQQRLDKLKATTTANFDGAYIDDMKQIHDKDEKLFAQESREGSDAYKRFAHETDLIVLRHIGSLHGLDGK